MVQDLAKPEFAPSPDSPFFQQDTIQLWMTVHGINLEFPAWKRWGYGFCSKPFGDSGLQIFQPLSGPDQDRRRAFGVAFVHILKICPKPVQIHVNFPDAYQHGKKRNPNLGCLIRLTMLIFYLAYVICAKAAHLRIKSCFVQRKHSFHYLTLLRPWPSKVLICTRQTRTNKLSSGMLNIPIVFLIVRSLCSTFVWPEISLLNKTN